MASISTLIDRVKIFVLSSGTGPFQLGSAVPAYRGIEALADGGTYSYAVESGSTYEAGTFTYVSSTNTAIRTPVLSSNGGAAVAFPAGVQLVLTALAQDLVSTGGTFPIIDSLGSGTSVAPSQRAATEPILALQSAVALRVPFAILAALEGSGLVGFSHDVAAAVNTVGERLQRTVFVTDASFNATGDGVTDDTDAINDALAFAFTKGAIVFAPAGEYRIEGTIVNPGVTLTGAGSATIFRKIGVGELFINDYTLPVKNDYFLTNSPINSTTLTLANIAHAANFAASEYAIIASTAAYDSPVFDPQRKGEFVRIKDISGASLPLWGPLSDDYLIAAAPQLVPVTLTNGIEYRDFVCYMDPSVAPVGGADPATEQRNVITTRFAFEPKFRNIQMHDSLGAGIALEGCIGAIVEVHTAYDFGSADMPDGTSTAGLGGYGYGILERGLNIGLRASNLYYERIRHGYTNGASFIFTTGRPVGAVIANGIHLNAKLSAWDSHQLGFGQQFIGLWSFGSLGVGVTLRSNSVMVLGGGAVGSVGAAVALYKGSNENAEDCVVDGFYARGNNWGSTTIDGSTTDWTLQPTFLDQGTNNVIQNFNVDSAYGPLWGTAANAVNPTLRNGRARDLNKVGVANKALWMRTTGAAVYTVDNVQIDVSNGFVSDLVRNESSSFSNIPRINGLTTIGTISGLYYSSALVNNQQVHWTGSGFEGFRSAVTLTGVTNIDLQTILGHRITVSRAAAESLTTATGRAIEGATLEIIGGSTGVIITHSASGADTFSCKGGVNATVSTSTRIRFERAGTQWVEQWRSF